MTDDNGQDDNMDNLTQAAARLRTEISPEHDLWPGIAAAIEQQPAQRSRWTPMLAQAAAVVLLIGASSLVTYKLTATDPIVRPVIQDPAMIFTSTSFGSRYNLGPGFQDARDSLADELDKELERLSPAARTDIATNLTIIHEALAELNKALQQEPDNSLLQEQLLRTYRDELALLRRVSGLSRNVMMRNDI